MAKYRVRVSTGEAFGAGTWDKMSITIVGTQGETPRLPLDHLGKEFTVGAVSVWGAGVGAEEGGGGTVLSDSKPTVPLPRRRTSR